MWKSLCFLAVLWIACGPSRPEVVQLTQTQESLTIEGRVPDSVKRVEIQLRSDRNRAVSSYHQASSLDPDFEALQAAPRRTDWNIFYPVVDVALEEQMEGVVQFDQAVKTSYSLNGASYEAVFELEGQDLKLPSDRLQYWENNLYLQPAPAEATSFYLKEAIPVEAGKLAQTYQLLTPDWGGEVVVLSLPDRQELFRGTTTAKPAQPELDLSQEEALSEERLLASLQATVAFTLRCQDQTPGSMTQHGLNLFYDLDARTFRRPIWIWGWGPSIKLLLDCADIPEFGMPADSLRKVAGQIGETSLRFQEMDPAHPAYGIITSRWSENKGTLPENAGFEQYYSIADAQFLAGWGWIPLYEATGDRRYLDGVKLLTETTDTLTRAFDIIPMDYLIRAERWKDYALNEQGFGTEGINELYRVEPDPAYQQIGDAYMKMILAKFDTEEGIWNRKYLIDEQEKVPTAYHCRGTGWAMEGLVAAYELTRDSLYLAKARKMAGVLLAHQLENGSWSYDIKAENPEEISEKGTALWSLLLYKLYRHTGDPTHLAAARKALTWCLENQYRGPDPLAQGGLIGVSRQSGVVYRPWFRLACTYASGFFGLAVLEELALQAKE